MSFELSRATWDLLGMPSAKKVVLAYLADRANKDGRCWPSVKTISESTGLCKRAVNDSLTWLEADGALTRIRRSHANVHEVNVYLVTPKSSRCPLRRARGDAADAVGSAAGALGTASGAVGDAADAEGYGTRCSTLMQGMQGGDAGDAHRTTINNQENHQGNNQENQEDGAGARRRSTLRHGAASPGAVAVFDHWRSVMNHPSAKFDEKRAKTIREALKLGYTLDQLRQAIEGCKASAWHMGANKNSTVYDSIDLILRDAAHIDQFIALAAKRSPSMSPAAMQTAQAGQRWLSEQSAIDQVIERAA